MRRAGDDARRPPARDPQSRPVLALTVLLVLLALWRVRQGVDGGDGAHVVALAVRLASGAVPFVDEMNAQALGSLAAVPFTWVWLQVVGLEGIVLASRVWYLLLALTVGTVGYRALRTGLRPLPAFVGTALAVVPTPYNLLVTSYNSVPGLALGLATFAGYAALTTRSGRWAAVSGAALAVAVLSHPSSLPAAVTLGLAVLLLGLRRAAVVRGLLLGGGTLSALVVLWVVVGPGVGAVAETLAYTADYQSSRPHPVDRLLGTVSRFGDVVLGPAFLPALLLAVVAGLPQVPERWRAVALGAAPAAAALPAALSLADPTRVATGATSGTYAVLVALLLLAPVALWAARAHHHGLRLLLALSAPPALVGMVTYALATSAKASWGVVAPPAVALYGVVGVGVVLAVTRAWSSADAQEGATPRRPATLVAAVSTALVVGPLLAVHPLHSFRDPAPWRATTPVTEGPNAGLFTTAERAVQECRTRLVLTSWVGPGESLLAYAEPSVYLYTEAPMATNIVWLASFGHANLATVEWLDAREAWPDVVVVNPSVSAEWRERVSTDPLLTRIDEDYPNRVGTGPLAVLRQDGATAPPGGAPDLASCDLP